MCRLSLMNLRVSSTEGQMEMRDTVLVILDRPLTKGFILCEQESLFLVAITSLAKPRSARAENFQAVQYIGEAYSNPLGVTRNP